MKDFYDFLSDLPLSEGIDSLAKNIKHEGKQIADFFFLKRRITCEVKFLSKDTKEKVEKIVDGLRGREDFPVFYGSWELNKILKYLKDGDSIHEKIAYAVTSPIEDIVKDANRQIRDTKELFHESKSMGLVIIVNRSVDILDAELVGWRINRCLHKKRQGSDPRFECVNGLWFIDEAHSFFVHRNLEGPISIIFEGHGNSGNEVGEYIEYLTVQWATWKGFPSFKIPSEALTKNRLKFVNASGEKNTEERTLRRHELWRKGYKENPYLRPLPKDKLLQYGRNLLIEITPHFLKAGIQSTMDEKMILMERFTHLLEEINYRGIDMKEFKFNEIDKAVFERFKPQQNSESNS